MVFWETVTEKEEVRFRDWNNLQIPFATVRILKTHQRGNVCRLICSKNEKRESTAEESTDSEGNRKFNLY